MGFFPLWFGIYLNIAGKDFHGLIQYGNGKTLPLHTNASIILIILSFFTVILTLFGCYCILKENKDMVGSYFVLVIVFFVLLIIAGWCSQSKEEIMIPSIKCMEEYEWRNRSKITEAWDILQTNVSINIDFMKI